MPVVPSIPEVLQPKAHNKVYGVRILTQHLIDQDQKRKKGFIPVSLSSKIRSVVEVPDADRQALKKLRRSPSMRKKEAHLVAATLRSFTNELEKQARIFGAQAPDEVSWESPMISQKVRRRVMKNYSGIKAREDKTPWMKALGGGAAIGGGIGALTGAVGGGKGTAIGALGGAAIGTLSGAIAKANDDANINEAKYALTGKQNLDHALARRLVHAQMARNAESERRRDLRNDNLAAAIRGK